jgi:hypothetical protein
MPTKIDKRRLQDGEKASSLTEPQTEQEIRQQLEILADGIRALQSLDDLGSEAANDAAWEDMLALQRKYDRLKKKLPKTQSPVETRGRGNQ